MLFSVSSQWYYFYTQNIVSSLQSCVLSCLCIFILTVIYGSSQICEHLSSLDATYITILLWVLMTTLTKFLKQSTFTQPTSIQQYCCQGHSVMLFYFLIDLSLIFSFSLNFSLILFPELIFKSCPYFMLFQLNFMPFPFFLF